jgi:SAM-dependent methyltransferase
MKCTICQSEMRDVGTKASAETAQVFTLAHCDVCHFSCVTNPRDDFEQIYDEAYYRGEGADVAVSYETETSDPRTARRYEWRGMLRVVRSARPVDEETEWLDFGCGLGGFVDYLRGHGFSRAVGHDEGYAARRLEMLQIPSVSTAGLVSASGRFDVVTAIEVLEHALDPVAVLRQICAALKPGGVLVLTTGNARPYRDKLAEWSYVVPDVHVSFFEPETLARAMRIVGLTPQFHGYSRGWSDIIRYKVLKSVHVQRQRWYEAIAPWPLIARVIDRRLGVSAQPMGSRGDEASSA